MEYREVSPLRQKKRFSFFSKWVSFLLVFLFLLTPLQALAAPQYPDVVGHWAEQTMRQGVKDGFIVGTNGKLNPDHSITLSEVLTILNRVLGTERTGNISSYGIPQNAWYREEAARSVALGLLSDMGEKPSFTKAMKRGDAFVVLVEAFQLMGTETDVSCLSRFKDANVLTNQNRAATATLVQLGIVKGSGTLLMSEKSMTRAEFMELLYRLIGTQKHINEVSGTITTNVIVSTKADQPEESPSPSPTPTPDTTVSPSPTPTPDTTVSPSPTPTPDTTVSPSPTPTPDTTVPSTRAA